MCFIPYARRGRLLCAYNTGSLAPSREDAHDGQPYQCISHGAEIFAATRPFRFQQGSLANHAEMAAGEPQDIVLAGVARNEREASSPRAPTRTRRRSGQLRKTPHGRWRLTARRAERGASRQLFIQGRIAPYVSNEIQRRTK